MREAGLPILVPDDRGEQRLTFGSKGVVRAVYPDTHRVDIETDKGGYLSQVLVLGPYMPEVHQDSSAPSHVVYLHFEGAGEAVAWPETHRRLLGPQDVMPGEEGQSQPERRYFHTNPFIIRLGDVTIRVTNDNRVIAESEQGDFILFDATNREIHLHSPRLVVGTDEQNNRTEYVQDDSFRAFAPLVLLGTETGDRIQYMNGASILLQAPDIKLTATNSIVLDPPRISLGADGATEGAVLGNLFMTLYNSMIQMLNTHVHAGVTGGTGLSAVPTTQAPLMTTAQLSDTVKVVK